jgi:multidrug efflux pump subunit AcrB
VVLENIFRFIEEKKKSPMVAAREATAEIGLAVMATTLRWSSSSCPCLSCLPFPEGFFINSESRRP